MISLCDIQLKHNLSLWYLVLVVLIHFCGFLDEVNATPETSQKINGEILKRKVRFPPNHSDQYGEEFGASHDFWNKNHSPLGKEIAKQLLENQVVMSGRGKIPLFKQSYPGLYVKGDLKEFGYEPTMSVTHGNFHHGKLGHLFLLQPDTAHVYRGIAHSVDHEFNFN